MTPNRTVQRALRLVAAAAWLVPAALRDDWRREWEGELSAWVHAGRPHAIRHALGAWVDAAWMRQRQLADFQTIDDLRHGWRQVRRQAGFGALSVGILGVAMAACITAFGVVSQLLLRPLPYADPDRIVTVWERQGTTEGRLDVSPGNFLDWRDRAKSFETLAGVEPYSHDYTDGDRPEVWRMLNVTTGFFDSFRVTPLLGRTFAPEEHTDGRHRVVVLSAGVWRTRFAADPGVVGRRITLNGEPWEVVGVMPDDFLPHLLEERPGTVLAWAPKVPQEYEARIRGGGFWQVVGRLAPGVTLDAARAEMDTIAVQLEAEQPRTNKGSRIDVIGLREHLVGDVRPAVTLFAGAVVVVLLIACANVMNLMLARGAVRAHEFAVRHSLGASRWRLVAQLLAESLLLSGLAAIVALTLAAAATRALATLGPADVLWLDSLHVDLRAAAFAIGLSVGVAALAGLVPALRLSGVGLQGATRTATADRGHRRLRSGLVVAEVALALVLVSGAALLVRSFVNLIRVDTGFARSRVAVVQMFAWDRNPRPDQLRTFFGDVLTRVAAIPGVEAAGLVTAMPFIEANIDVQALFTITGDPPPAPGEEPRASVNVATPSYFAAMGVPLLRGRLLDESDGPQSPPVAVVSQAFVDRYFRGRDPLGRRILGRDRGRPVEVEIVGVVGALRHGGLDDTPRVELYRPFAQGPSGSMTLVARTGGDPGTLVESVKHAVWAVDPLQTFYSTATLDELVSRTVSNRRFALVVLTAFAALALVLATAGLYSVLSAIALQQQRELGVRMALGATWTSVALLVVRRGLAMVAVGLVAGIAGAAGAGHLLGAFLFGVSALDPWTLGGAALTMLLVATPACLAPARRAAGVSPAVVLRAE
jgi:putative ABC transport system permease protein